MDKFLKSFIKGKYTKKAYAYFMHSNVYGVDVIYYHHKHELKFKLFIYTLYKKYFSKIEKEFKNYKISSALIGVDNTSMDKIIYLPTCDWCHKDFIKNEIRITTEMKQYHRRCFINNAKKIINEYPYKNLIVKIGNYDLESTNLIEVKGRGEDVIT